MDTTIYRQGLDRMHSAHANSPQGATGGTRLTPTPTDVCQSSGYFIAQQTGFFWFGTSGGFDDAFQVWADIPGSNGGRCFGIGT